MLLLLLVLCVVGLSLATCKTTGGREQTLVLAVVGRVGLLLLLLSHKRLIQHLNQ